MCVCHTGYFTTLLLVSSPNILPISLWDESNGCHGTQLQYLTVSSWYPCQQIHIYCICTYIYTLPRNKNCSKHTGCGRGTANYYAILYFCLKMTLWVYYYLMYGHILLLWNCVPGSAWVDMCHLCMYVCIHMYACLKSSSSQFIYYILINMETRGSVNHATIRHPLNKLLSLSLSPLCKLILCCQGPINTF